MRGITLTALTQHARQRIRALSVATIRSPARSRLSVNDVPPPPQHHSQEPRTRPAPEHIGPPQFSLRACPVPGRSQVESAPCRRGRLSLPLRLPTHDLRSRNRLIVSATPARAER